MAVATAAASSGILHLAQARRAVSVPAVLGLLAVAAATATVTGSIPVPRDAGVTSIVAQQQRVTAGVVASLTQPAVAAAAAPKAPVIAFAEPKAPMLKFNDQGYYDQLRSRIHWVDVRLGDATLQTPDDASRILLSQAAARKARLDEVGLSFRDVYGIINAETSWIPRMGSSKDGTPNLGIAQFEPATARALGLHNPNDPVEAVHALAMHLKDAAEWSAKRISGLKLNDAQRALKLREGLSIYYNLSSKGRAAWNGLNTAKLPIETQRHISNARRGAREAEQLAQQLANVRALTHGSGVMTASFQRANGS